MKLFESIKKKAGAALKSKVADIPIGRTFEQAIKAGGEGLKAKLAQTAVESKEVQQYASTQIEKQAASSMGEKFYEYWKNHKPLIIGGSIAAGLGMVGLLFMAFKKKIVVAKV